LNHGQAEGRDLVGVGRSSHSPLRLFFEKESDQLIPHAFEDKIEVSANAIIVLGHLVGYCPDGTAPGHVVLLLKLYMGEDALL
jgi:hypothetical protein